MTRARDVANIDGILTTTGDTFYASSGGTPARLGIGSTDQVLKVSGGVPVWATPSAATPTFVGASAWMNTTVAIPNATFTNVALADELFDTNSIHDNTTNNSRMTIPTGYAGKWLVNGTLSWASGTGIRSIALYKNGSYYAIWDTSPSTGTFSANFSVVMNLAVADYVEMRVYQTSGGNLNLYGNSAGNGTITTFGVSYLGA